MLMVMRRKVVYLLITASAVLLLLGTPIASVYADCEGGNTNACSG